MWLCLHCKLQPNTTLSLLMAMLLRRLCSSPNTGAFLPKSSTSFLPGRRRHIDVIHSASLTTTPTSNPFPICNSHPLVIQSVTSNSHQDVELEKHLGTNRNVDHDPNSPRHHKHNPSLTSHDPTNSHQKNRTHRLDDSGPHSSPQPPKNQGKKAEITDREWEIRTGRAIYILQQTLPDFFSLGLVSSSTDIGNGKRKALAQYPSAFQDTIPESARARQADKDQDLPELESIYSPKIRLVYTPPVRLPSPFPATLHVEGLPLYMASSVFVRHTLKTLYSDLHVELRRVYVQTPKSQASGVGDDHSHREEGTERVEGKKPPSRREKSLFIGLVVKGTARVSGAVGEWEVNATYTFSPITGLIHIHTINSIHPAPHQAAYDAIRSSLERVLGLAGGGVTQPTGEVTRAEEVRIGVGVDGRDIGERR